MRANDQRRRGARSAPPESASYFRCARCSRRVSHLASGTQHRNHCPHCLWSLHVDIDEGDRASDCLGLMEPVAVWVKRNGEWALVHRCGRCGQLRSNRIAGDDNHLALLSLALRPIVLPAFPLPLEPEGRAQAGERDDLHRGRD